MRFAPILFGLLLWPVAAPAAGAQAVADGSPPAVPAPERQAPPASTARKFVLPPVARNARLDVINLGADDCPFCRQWEFGSRQKLLESPQAKAFSFHEVKIATLRNPLRGADYPPDLQWVYKQVGSTRGVPRFLLAIDGKVVLSSYGTGEYRRTFLPALNEVVRTAGRTGA